MNTDWLVQWLKAAGVRALKTFAQTALAVLLLGEPMADIVSVDWRGALGVGALAAVASLLTSVAGLPEVQEPTSTSGNTDPHSM